MNKFLKLLVTAVASAVLEMLAKEAAKALKKKLA